MRGRFPSKKNTFQHLNFVKSPITSYARMILASIQKNTQNTINNAAGPININIIALAAQRLFITCRSYFVNLVLAHP